MVGRSVGRIRRVAVRCSCSWPDKKSWPRLFYRPRHSSRSVGQPVSPYIIIIPGRIGKGGRGPKEGEKGLAKVRNAAGWRSVAAFPFIHSLVKSSRRELSLSLSRLFFPLLLLLFPFLSRLIVQHEGRRKGRGERRSSLVRTNERRSFGDVPRVAPDAPPLPVPYICKSCRPIVSLFTLPLPLLDKKIQVKLSSG